MKKLTLILITTLLFCGCKKDFGDTQLLSPGTVVWIKSSSYNSDKKSLDLKLHLPEDVNHRWLIDSLSAETNDYFNNGKLNFYWVHNDAGQVTVLAENAIQRTKPTWIGKLITNIL